MCTCSFGQVGYAHDFCIGKPYGSTAITTAVFPCVVAGIHGARSSQSVYVYCDPVNSRYGFIIISIR